MATERTITMRTGELTVCIRDQSPWKEQALAVLCEQALLELLDRLGVQHGALQGGAGHASSAPWPPRNGNGEADGVGSTGE